MDDEEVLIVENLLSESECERILRLYEDHSHRSSGRDYSGNKVLHYHDLRSVPEDQECLEHLLPPVFEHLQSLFKFSDVYLESLFVTMLPPGGHHPLHADNEKYEHGEWVPNHTPQRDFSAIVYLNSDFAGGELCFEGRELKVRPKPGLLVAFPSHHEFVHRVAPVVSGKRYSIALWFTKNRGRALCLRNHELSHKTMLPESRIDETIATDPLREKFLRDQHVFLPHLIPVESARSFDVVTRSLAGRRVVCGESPVSWEEQRVPGGTELFSFMMSPRILRLLASVLDVKNSDRPSRTVCWISRYQTGEYIGPHRDSSGTIQMLLCLSPPAPENGGLLGLRLRNEDRYVRLEVGDGLLFRATALEHFTTPLVATEECPAPVRVVASARYFFDLSQPPQPTL